ncbi:MAG: hypothetical protein QM760_14845 [Nibricoccus sp.]
MSVPQIGLWQEYNREFMSVFEQTRTLLAKPEEALAECQERVSASWERYKRSLARQEKATGAKEAKP